MALNFREPSVDELLADPLILKVMRADHVEAAEFERTLRIAAGHLEGAARAEPSMGSPPGAYRPLTTGRSRRRFPNDFLRPSLCGFPLSW
jgi:hypothetical protein